MGKVFLQLLLSVWSLSGSRISFLSVYVKDFYQKKGQIEDDEVYNVFFCIIFTVMHLFIILVSLLLIKGATKAKTDDLMP